MYNKILVPIDGSESANSGLREVARIANQKGRQVLLVHVIDSIQRDDEFGEGTVGAILQTSPRKSGEDILQLAKTALVKLGVACEGVLLESRRQRISQVIVDYALHWNAELIVMGTHGRKGVSRMVLGSNAENVIRAVPVLLVRHSSPD